MDETKKILIVEDDPLLSQTLIDSFKQAGFEVTHAADGVDGLHKAFATHPDLIILDLIMPKMDGMTMYKQLLDDEWGKNAAVMILTSNTDQEKLFEAKEKGVYYYLMKENFSPDDVVKKAKERLHLDQPTY